MIRIYDDLDVADELTVTDARGFGWEFTLTDTGSVTGFPIAFSVKVKTQGNFREINLLRALKRGATARIDEIQAAQG